VLLVYTTQRWRFHKGRGGWNPTLAFINVVYFYFISFGVSTIYQGGIISAVLGDVRLGIAGCVQGACCAAPYIAALLYGQQRLFKVMARKFEDKRRGLDSAVIAELMNDPALRVGADWWTHHGNNLTDEYPGLFDHRRNWTRAVIVEIETVDDKHARRSGGGGFMARKNKTLRFSVNPNVAQRPLGVGITQSMDDGGVGGGGGGSGGGGGGGGGGTSFSSRRLVVPNKVGGGSGGFSFFGRRPSVISNEVALGGGGGSSKTSFFGRRRSVISNKVAPVPATLTWVTRSDDAKEGAVGLLTKAHESLRTLGGQDLTRGLVAKYVVQGKRVNVWLI